MSARPQKADPADTIELWRPWQSEKRFANPAAINFLKKNPTTDGQFDAIFGTGASEKAAPEINRFLKLNQLRGAACRSPT
jgi:hypothetical protein